MSQKLIHPSDFLEMPWQNGGGTTFEIFRGEQLLPCDGDDWDWRFSLAHIDQSGPFSPFVGVDRTFVSLGPDAIDLLVDGARTRVENNMVREFPGETFVEAKLLGGPTRDLNLMAKRGRVTAFCQVGLGTWRARTGDVVALYARDAGESAYVGDLRVPMGSVGLVRIPAEEEVHFRGGISFLVRPSIGGKVHPAKFGGPPPTFN